MYSESDFGQSSSIIIISESNASWISIESSGVIRWFVPSIKDLNKIISFMEKDKKNNSKKINLILLKKINYPIIDKFFDKSKIRTFLKKELIN